MKLHFHSPVLFTHNLNEMKDFYINILNLNIVDDFGACVFLSGGLSLWTPDDKHPISEYIKKNKLKEQNNQLELCFETENFNEVLHTISDKKINYLHYEKTETWGQKTIRFFDPDNNLIEIGESIPAFVKRLYSEGLSLDEVSERTGVALTKVKEYCH
ncbi:MAG: VOC family protein [Bacteroidales bacterium]|nr:VOC family protein [Bacteroidales bacterium]MBN2821028.1 VOC family protein [Bacteroidales bacterium]